MISSTNARVTAWLDESINLFKDALAAYTQNQDDEASETLHAPDAIVVADTFDDDVAILENALLQAEWLAAGGSVTAAREAASIRAALRGIVDSAEVAHVRRTQSRGERQPETSGEAGGNVPSAGSGAVRLTNTASTGGDLSEDGLAGREGDSDYAEWGRAQRALGPLVIERGSQAWDVLLKVERSDWQVSIDDRRASERSGVAIKINEGMWSPTLSTTAAIPTRR